MADNFKIGVYLWGERVGAAVWNDSTYIAEFTYVPNFIKKGFQIAPIKMPLLEKTYAFTNWDDESPWGVPGLLAASLPDMFGRSLTLALFKVDGRPIEFINPLEHLFHIGDRGMGAREIIERHSFYSFFGVQKEPHP